eukprot:591321-Amphidinium_carterae.1
MSWPPRQTAMIKATEGAWKIVGRQGKPAKWDPQQPNKGQVQNEGRGRGGFGAQAQQASLFLVQRTEGAQKGSARRAGEESKTCLLTGAGAEEADCRRQGHASVATTPPSCHCGGAGTQARGPPCERPN